ncbi:glycosyltransferase family 4 protein [Rugamonas apoptosis]|uniref:Glycosyltransferase family 4 protein n=1 Tax=Rugamonas apoptosis TaxID=2758570 RepID=A0A7W2IMZ1_9BURK|nr:glycosyltransferase family 4 protein [Rugamonas apoptosis]MBA5690076.1 glycosyltransferase family 4 protein [Rugamonas apoptosis]
MRILRFMGYPINNFSTLERMMLSQASRLQQLGHTVEIAFDGIRTAAAAQAAQAYAPDVKLHFDLPANCSLQRPWTVWAYARAARRLIAAGHFDIVHLYFDPGARVINQLARLFPNVKFLRTIGSTPVPRGTRRYLDRLKQRKWVLDLARMEKVICVGEHIGDMLVQYGVARQRIVVIPNATDVERFQRLRPHRHQQGARLRLGFVGRLNPVKNIELMIRGMGLLVREHQVRNIELTLIGDGQLRQPLEALAVAEGVADYVHFAGAVSDIPAALNDDIDVYVQASHNEGCPAAVIEAMACEVPVILSDIEGHRQVATPELHGTYFRAGDTADFVRCVLALQEDYGRYRAQAARARQHVVATYSIDAWIRQELGVYTALLAD